MCFLVIINKGFQNMSEIVLGVNIDHVATLRQARGTRYPDPVKAALDAEQAGAQGITLHLREDARHIQEYDVRRLKELLQTRMNLEIALTPAMIDFSTELQPEHVCFVPEKREEITTEGGLDVAKYFKQVQQANTQLNAIGTQVSLFIDPELTQVDAACEAGAPAIELHTGAYADAKDTVAQAFELERIVVAAKYAASKGLIVNAGHGLHYHNVQPIAAICELHELNIGHALIAHAVFVGLQAAVKEMLAIMHYSRNHALLSR